jgi:polyhydroxyalkanoate synthesis regulator phasin
MLGIKNPFKKKKEISLPPVTQKLELPIKEESRKIEQAPSLQEGKRTEMEVLIAKIDALKFQYEALSEKISNIEKMVKEIYELAKSSQ